MRLHKLANNGRAAPLHEKTVDGSNEPSQHLRSEGHTRSSSKLKLRGSETTRVADVLAELRLTPRNQRQVLAMGCLAVFAIFIYFSAPWFAEYWRFDIGTIINALEPAIGQPSRGPLKTSPQIAPKAAAAPQMARIARGAKVRANPGTWGEIISTLPRGVRVAVIETRGNWALIKADGANGKGQPLVGWVSISFLRGAPGK